MTATRTRRFQRVSQIKRSIHRLLNPSWPKHPFSITG